MVTRTFFDNNLKELKEKVLHMGDEAKKAVILSMESLVEQDSDKAQAVIAGDNKIDHMDEEINEQAILLIAKEAPVATDLRKIIAALRVSSEIERIADMAVNIAKSTLHIGGEKYIKEIIEIPKMLEISLEMLTDSLTSFYAEDAHLAKKCAQRDDEVDEMYGRLIKELMGYIPQKPTATNQITQLAFVCRYIERIGDHTTNIAENVIYLVTGKNYDLNA
ncbi:phosphate signaling complex protein PhoU [Mesobacillus subterraneus]|uniref:Phosphate-specific transport system accessory protein PhoU n=1 Tax=Mesobacillus subterraneus TaxID=285983 RepID=A0A0D6Z9Z7_9BACI|nr:phosphate signaling complex protein PhoU [Mesobacillus subterraneus]KIY22327.1 PhoU family transcriptional regulator [Mesobacillus subterraneus]